MNAHLADCRDLDYHRGDDVSEVLASWLDQQTSAVLLLDLMLRAEWLDKGADLPLTAVYQRDLQDGERGCRVCVVDTELAVSPDDDGTAVFAAAVATGAAVYRSGAPIGLAPLSIPKPWGREIWYTGIEERGVCCFVDEFGGETPIPWLQLATAGILGPADTPPVLLKILDPLPEPVRGDLYFELHHEKREVYVVTHVDSGAWPDGVGAIRYGFSPERIEAAGGEREFRQQYLEAVKAYEVVRRSIDALPADQSVGAALLDQEHDLREQMNAFTHLRPLRAGDVVKVPLLLPHSLQHGVRTVEFQTPVYERQIISFAQEVLTQSHWDTEEAVEQMSLIAPAEEALDVVQSREGVTIERIVSFEDFKAYRVSLASGARWQPSFESSYGLLMSVAGEVTLGELSIAPEQAVFVPAAACREYVVAVDQPAVMLLATPTGQGEGRL